MFLYIITTLNMTPFLNQLNQIFQTMNEEYPIDNELEIRVILSLIQRHNQALYYDCPF